MWWYVNFGQRKTAQVSEFLYDGLLTWIRFCSNVIFPFFAFLYKGFLSNHLFQALILTYATY
ncbi:MAG TPA: hypothetical protein DD638_00940 [Pasteurellaceae bacterium]|nr:hypothetical protein [Pasteurellaceae bacterium]